MVVEISWKNLPYMEIIIRMWATLKIRFPTGIDKNETRHAATHFQKNFPPLQGPLRPPDPLIFQHPQTIDGLIQQKSLEELYPVVHS